MQNTPLQRVIIEHGTNPQTAVIWLHGLGADGHDFAGIVPQLQLPDDLAVKFIFPHAPVRPVTINAGIPMRAWFDILGLERDSHQDETGIRQGIQQIHDLIALEIEGGFSSKKIVLAGFSQGGALALSAGLRFHQPLAGILALSSYLPLAATLPQEKSLQNQQTPIMVAHGLSDPIVALSLGEMSRDYLKQLNYNVEWHTYPMQHQVTQQEILDIRNWLLRVLSY